MATNGHFAHPQEQYLSSAPPVDAGTPQPAPGHNSSNNNNNTISKDEVGWYFVEQYYTTLSKSPEKLHLFYSKGSQFVYGQEAELANVSVGRATIQERIKQLDFQDCKVRISNVDSQASFDNIVIQVIGETSNKAAEPKKFVQTFVLAQQPSGYFVLNDILRYISEDGDEPTADTAAAASAPVAVEEPPAAAAVPASAPAQDTPSAPAVAPAFAQAAAPGPAPAPAAAAATTEAPQLPKGTDQATKDEPAKGESGALDTDVVNQKLEAAAKDETTLNGGELSREVTKTSDAKDVPVPLADVDATTAELAEGDAKQPEKPQDPVPSPVSKPMMRAEPVVAEPLAPAKPITWATRVAAAVGPRPVVPLPKTATPPSATQNRTAATAAAAGGSTVQPAAPASAPVTAPAPVPAAAPPAAAAAVAPVPATSTEGPAKEYLGWQTAGADSRRQNRPQSISHLPGEKESTMGYVKYVTEKVQDYDLRNALAAYGELSYFDINRQKNCAFVEFKTLEGYHAAVSASPHIVNGENIVVEPRRPKSNAYGGGSYASGRGNASGRGRGGYDGNRNGGRGNYVGQNRGRGGMPRGRGGSQGTNP